MFAELTEQLRVREKKGLKRYRQTLEGPQTTRVTIADREYLAFCSNDYLGLASHPKRTEAFNQAAKKYGVGSGAAHLINGHNIEHQLLFHPDVQLHIYSFDGKLKAILPSQLIAQQQEFDVSVLPTGIYIIELQQSDQTIRSKLIIAR